jgi:hypothetical protein
MATSPYSYVYTWNTYTYKGSSAPAAVASPTIIQTASPFTLSSGKEGVVISTINAVCSSYNGSTSTASTFYGHVWNSANTRLSSSSGVAVNSATYPPTASVAFNVTDIFIGINATVFTGFGRASTSQFMSWKQATGSTAGRSSTTFSTTPALTTTGEYPHQGSFAFVEYDAGTVALGSVSNPGNLQLTQNFTGTAGTYGKNVQITWGDGNVTNFTVAAGGTPAAQTHTYATAGNYTVGATLTYATSVVGIPVITLAGVSRTVYTVPGAPGASAATVNGGVSISYSAPSYTGTGIDYYQYSTDLTNWYTTPSNPFTISNTRGASTTVNVRAHNSMGFGAYTGATATAGGPPSAPGVTVTDNGNSTVNVSYTAPSNNYGSTISSYSYYTSLNGTPVTAPSNPFTLSCTKGTSITVYMYAVADYGNGDTGSGTATATDVPDQLTLGTVTPTSGTSVSVGWSGPTNNGGIAVDLYQGAATAPVEIDSGFATGATNWDWYWSGDVTADFSAGTGKQTANTAGAQSTFRNSGTNSNTLAAGDIIYVSMSYRCATGVSPGIELVTSPNAGQAIYFGTGAVIYASTYAPASATWTSWGFFVTIPSGQACYTPYLRAYLTNAGDWVEYDNVWINRFPTASWQTLSSNPGTLSGLTGPTVRTTVRAHNTRGYSYPSWMTQTTLTTTYTGAASLTASSTLTTAGVVTKPAAASLAAASTLTSVGVVTENGAVTLSASSTLTAGATATAVSSASLAATATLTSNAFVTRFALAALTAASTLTSTGAIVRSGQATLTAASTLTTAGVIEKVALASLSAVQTLTSAAARTVVMAASLSATATLTSAIVILRPAAAALTAAATLTATGAREQSAASSMSAVSTLTAAATAVAVASSSLAAVATLTAAGLVTRNGAVNLSGSSTLTAGATQAFFAASALVAAATLTAGGFRNQLAAVSLAAASTLTVAGLKTGFAVAALVAVGSLTSVAVPYRLGVFKPNAIYVQTNLTGSYVDIDDSPDTPDGSTLVPGGSGAIEMRIGFEDHTGQNMRTLAGDQIIRVLVRKP